MTTFGGGLGRFREECTTPENTCREIVEVAGGHEWRIRKLADTYHDYSWKYPGCSVIVNYHFNRLQNTMTELEDNQKIFYAQVSHFVSPVEISLQPKYLVSARKSIMTQMNAYYKFTTANESKTFELAKEQILISSAKCNLRWTNNTFEQLKNVEMKSIETIPEFLQLANIVVELVDIGTQVLVSQDRLRPLLKRFGRAPPLCLKCRVDGVSINDLEIKDLLEFKKIVESCNALFRVELKSVEEPFLIDLFHPTIFGKNMCEQFLPPPDDEGKIERLERSWIAHLKKVNEEFEEDEDDYWNHHWAGDIGYDANEECEKREIVRRLAKCQRAPRFEKDQLTVAHIENSQLIYLQYPWQFEMRNRIEDILRVDFESYPEVPENFELIDLTCVARIDSKVIVRCLVESINPDEIALLLIDYGFHVDLETSSVELRLLPNEELVAEEPMVTIVTLAGSAIHANPHHSETVVLQKLIPRGTKVHFKWDKKSKNTPLRGLIFTKNWEDISQKMNKILLSTYQNTRCSEIDLYRPNSEILSNLILFDHVYRPVCHPFYSKGVIELFQI